MLNGIQNFLSFVNENWTSVMVIAGLLLAIYQKAKVYFVKSDEEKVEIAKVQIKETMLKMITDAEIDFTEWNQAGSIKRSQVIGKIFENYPVLSKVVNQQEVIGWIDNEINSSLKTLRGVMKENKGE